MDTLNAIRKRCSLKTHISTRQIEVEKLNTILEAGRLAASARNNQPWRFIVVQDRQVIEQVTTAFSESNQVILDAPVILIVCARPTEDIMRDGKQYFLFDVGMAVGNILLAATDMGLITHPMTAFNEQQMKQILHIPDDVRTVVATPLAYPLEDSYDEASRERLLHRTRKRLIELVYYNRWNEIEPA